MKDGLDTRDKAQNKSYQMTYAVETVENLFTRCGHERYPKMMEIKQSYNHTWKVTNVVKYSDIIIIIIIITFLYKNIIMWKCADVHIHTQTHT